ncbi:unnamed protein product [Prorocentrum cordatum]|uniref:Uncharacterized protein n=1 Tax=Prorocentrum cordatum TaxID=2364126 RepID=A0ABN9RM65_9DINO|nr:unnamed protein product [Polarella glacialis]
MAQRASLGAAAGLAAVACLKHGQSFVSSQGAPRAAVEETLQASAPEAPALRGAAHAQQSSPSGGAAALAAPAAAAALAAAVGSKRRGRASKLAAGQTSSVVSVRARASVARRALDQSSRYADLSLTEEDLIKNGQHVLVAYIMKPKAGYDYLATAAHFAAESSTGTNVNVCTTDDFTKTVDALVYYIDPENEEMKIAYPTALFDRNITDGRAMMCSVLTLSIGNNQGMGDVDYGKIYDIYFPPQYLRLFDGPSCCVIDMWRILGRGTVGGRDFHQETTNRKGNQTFCQMNECIPEVVKAMRAAQEETGQGKLFSANITADDPNEMIARAKYILNQMGPMAVLEALREGNDPAGDVCVMSATQLQEAQALATQHEIAKPFLMVCSDTPADEAPPGSNVSYVEALVQGRPTLKRCTTVTLGSGDGGKSAPPLRAVEGAAAPAQQDSVTLRCTVKREYTTPAEWTSARQNPGEFATRGMPLASVVAAEGFAEKVDSKSSRVLEAHMYIKVLRADADKLITTFSGSSGRFYRVIARDRGKTPDDYPVRWIARHKDEENELYHARVMKIATDEAESKGLVLRPGSNSDLGVRGLRPTETPLSTWRIHGVNEWAPEMLTGWLTNSGWRQVEIRDKPSGRFGWLVRADPHHSRPGHDTTTKADAWKITFPGDTGRAAVRVERYVMAPRGSQEEVKTVKTRRARWARSQGADAGKPVYEVAYEQACRARAAARAEEDADLEGMEASDRAKAAEERATRRNQEDARAAQTLTEERDRAKAAADAKAEEAKAKAATTQQPQQPPQQQQTAEAAPTSEARAEGASKPTAPAQQPTRAATKGWAKDDFEEIDAGTNGGDCQYRHTAIAYFLAHGKAKADLVKPAKAASLAKTMRAEVVVELENNREYYEPFIKHIPEHVSDESKPTTWEDYIHLIKTKPTRWGDAAVTLAAATHLHSQIFIYTGGLLEGDKWRWLQRWDCWPRESAGKAVRGALDNPPLHLGFRGGHCFVLVPRDQSFSTDSFFRDLRQRRAVDVQSHRSSVDSEAEDEDEEDEDEAVPEQAAEFEGIHVAALRVNGAPLSRLSHEVPIEETVWTCQLCRVRQRDCGTIRQQREQRKAHRRQAHPAVTAKQWTSMELSARNYARHATVKGQEAVKKGLGALTAEAREAARAKRRASGDLAYFVKVQGHDLVPIHLEGGHPSRPKRTRFATCKLCNLLVHDSNFRQSSRGRLGPLFGHLRPCPGPVWSTECAPWLSQTFLRIWHTLTETDKQALRGTWSSQPPARLQQLSTELATLAVGTFKYKRPGARSPFDLTRCPEGYKGETEVLDRMAALVRRFLGPQETRLDQTELAGSAALFRKAGWGLVWGSDGQPWQLPSRGRQAAKFGGLALATRSGWHARRLDSHRDPGGEFAVFEVTRQKDRMIVYNIHRRDAATDAQAKAFDDALETSVASHPRSSNLLLGGDWNEPAAEGTIAVQAAWQAHAAVLLADPGGPTRWQAKEDSGAIDYFLLRLQRGWGVSARVCDDVIADHKMVVVSFPCQHLKADEGTQRWRNAGTFTAPTDDADAYKHWQETLAGAAWEPYEHAADCDIDAWWTSWSDRAEDLLRRASRRPEAGPRKTELKRVPIRQEEILDGMTCRERGLRTLVGLGHAVLALPSKRDGRAAQQRQHLAQELHAAAQHLQIPHKGQTPKDVLRSAEECLEKELAKNKQERIRAWRRNMTSMGRKAYAWIKGDTVADSFCSAQGPDGTWYDGADALEKVVGYWDSHFADIRNRGTDVEGFCTDFAGEIAEVKARIQQRFDRLPAPIRHLESSFSEPTLRDFRRSLHKMRKTAGGVDGWRASELLYLPDDALEELRDLCLRAERQGRWPRPFQLLRQVMIPKSDGNKQYHKLRPIAIGPTVTRAWLRLRCAQIADHLHAGFDTCQAGGLTGRRLETLVDPLLEKIEEAVLAQEIEESGVDEDELDRIWDEPAFQELWHDTFVRAWDFASAFDTVCPDLVSALWLDWGIPDYIVRSVHSLWRRQERWIELGGCVAKRPVDVSASMPQGCVCGMLGMASVLAPAVWRLRRTVPAAVLSVYADDRTAAVPSRQHMDEVEGVWAQLEEHTALRSAPSKQADFAVHVTRRRQKRRKLHRCEGLGNSVGAEQIKVLGLELMLGKGAALTEAERSKLAICKRRIGRIRALPSTVGHKRAAVGGCALASLSWAAVLRWLPRTALSDLEAAIRRSLRLGKGTSASRHLLDLVAVQHAASPRYLLARRLWAFAAGRCARSGAAKLQSFLDLRLRYGLECAGVTGALLHYMRLLGWTFGPGQGGAGVFTSSAAARRLQVPLTAPPGERDHALRMALRQDLWQAYKESNRRDAHLARAEQVPYCHRAGLVVMKLISGKRATGAVHYLSVLTGDYWSDSRRAVARGDDPAATLCTRCTAGAVAGAEHDFWGCDLFRPWRRGVPVPASAFTRSDDDCGSTDCFIDVTDDSTAAAAHDRDDDDGSTDSFIADTDDQHQQVDHFCGRTFDEGSILALSFGKMEGDASDKNIGFMLQDDVADGPYYRQEWEGMKQTTPIISGGMNALRLPAFFENLGHSSVILTAGCGAFGHKDGPKQGAISCAQGEESWKLWKAGTYGDLSLSVGVVEYAKTHEELKGVFLTFQKDADQIYPGWKEKLGYTGESSVQAASFNWQKKEMS